MLDLRALNGGGSTPSSGIAQLKTKELSPAVDIILPTGTAKTGESKGLTYMITRLFNSVNGVLKFLANSPACKSSILTVSKSKWLATSAGSPGTSLTPTGSNEPSVSNLFL